MWLRLQLWTMTNLVDTLWVLHDRLAETFLTRRVLRVTDHCTDTHVIHAVNLLAPNEGRRVISLVSLENNYVAISEEDAALRLLAYHGEEEAWN